MKSVFISFLVMLLSVKVFSQSSQLNSYLIDLGRFKVPISNKGVLGDVAVDTIQSGLYDGKTVMYSGGFSMTGYENNFLWLNANFPSARIEDYMPGKVGSDYTAPINSIYVIKKTDPPFGDSWQLYKNAVEIGASYYDGNKDGKYNPIDLNGNGKWDLIEDCPDMLGDITTWCVYNDAVPKQVRRFNWNYPEGIEIHQTVFGYYLKDILFVRYRLINRGTVVQRLDSIIFSAWVDFDIGNYVDDLSGCDTTLQLGYTYNSGNDIEYGSDPPAVGVALLQGPPVYLPDITYFDLNGNSIFEDSIDAPIDSTLQKNGPLIKTIFFPGSKNQKMTSASNYRVHDLLGDPIIDNRIMRCYQKGYSRDCRQIDVCDWSFGTVLGNIDCHLVNPIFHFSGDPVHQIGWINIVVGDQRIMVNTGEFPLQKDKPIDIWLAYVVGRGTDSLNSVTKMKYNAMLAKQYYDDLPIIVHESEEPKYIPEEFRLYQNYPNPFNPVTKIRYDIPKVGSRVSLFVSLKVYDLLGNEVAELVNEEKSPGCSEVTFNAEKLSSGVYIYKLKTVGYLKFKKMILIK